MKRFLTAFIFCLAVNPAWAQFVSGGAAIPSPLAVTGGFTAGTTADGMRIGTNTPQIQEWYQGNIRLAYIFQSGGAASPFQIAGSSPGGVQINPQLLIENPDTSLSRSAAGVVAVGNGTDGDSSGTLRFSGPATVACGATCTLGVANKNTYTRLDQNSGSTATLPGATGSGTVYRLYVSVATTSASEKVLTNPTTDTIIGTASGENAGTAKIFVGNALTAHSIQMPFAGSQPSGGFIGDTIICTDVASTIWKCDVVYQAGTTPTTPYSTATS